MGRHCARRCVAVAEQLFAALDRGDVAGALALFTEDAVIDAESGSVRRLPAWGRLRSRRTSSALLADKTRRVTVLNTYVSGNVLVTRFEARSATIQKAGFERVILWGIREMRGDKIASYRCCMPERTDSQTAHFLEWDYAHPSVN